MTTCQLGACQQRESTLSLLSLARLPFLWYKSTGLVITMYQLSCGKFTGKCNGCSRRKSVWHAVSNKNHHSLHPGLTYISIPVSIFGSRFLSFALGLYLSLPVCIILSLFVSFAPGLYLSLPVSYFLSFAPVCI